MALPIQVNPKDPCIDIHTGRGQGSCTFANGFNCVCSCAGIAHAQLLRMVLTPENSKKLPDKYKQALANKVQTVQARIADIPHDKVTTIIHAQKQPKRVFFLCEDVSHPIIDYCRVIDILRWARENPLASQQVSKLCTCVQNHGINSYNMYMPWYVYNKQALWRHRRTARSESSLHLGQKLTLISPCSGKLRESTMFALVLFSAVMRTLS